MLFSDVIAVYCKNRIKHTNKLCGQNAELFNVKARGTYSAAILTGRMTSPKAETISSFKLMAENINY
jgi:hypothetical protein